MIERLLSAPCRVCGYNGQGYYQSGTHAKYCFFYEIGGLEERINFILNDWPHIRLVEPTARKKPIKCTCERCTGIKIESYYSVNCALREALG